MATRLSVTFRRWGSNTAREIAKVERMVKSKERRAAKLVVPWTREPREKTFAESWSSTRMAAFLKKKGALVENDPAKEFEKGWMIASATVLTRACVLEPELPENISSYREEQFYRKNEKCTHVNENDLKLTGVGDVDEKDVLFFPADRETEADRRKDSRSVWRKLDRPLFFVFKSKQNSKQYQFPQRITADSETLRGSAKKALKLVAGSSLQAVHHVGHAPLAVYKRVFTPEQQEKTKAYGAKVFFYPAYLIDGDIRKLDQGYDFRWLTKEECSNHLSSDYYQSVKDMLY